MLMVLQSKPAAPLFPSTSEAGIVDPMSAVNAPLSMRPSLRFRGEAADARDVSLAIVHTRRTGLNRLLYLKQT